MDLRKIREKLNLGIPLTELNLRVTYYSRVSTDHSLQINSLKNQNDFFDSMIKKNENWIYVKPYIDEGISGTSDVKRDNFMRMINDAKVGLFDLIITKEISRFSRNTLDSIKYTRELLNSGVAVLFVNDNINTVLPDSELRLTIMASLAQDEIRRLSERVKFGMNRSILNGNILGNDTLLGYKKDIDSGKLCVIESEAEIVRDIFYKYAVLNYSINGISKYLNDNNIKTRQKKSFSVSSVSRILRNPKYKGYYCGKKSEVVDYMTKKVKVIPNSEWITYLDNEKVSPIISVEMWNLANERLKKRSKKFGKSYDKVMYQNRYPFSAKIYCGNDLNFFHRRKQCKNDICWVCSCKLNRGVEICSSPIIREKEIFFILNDIINNSLSVDKVIKILMNIYTKCGNSDLNILKLQKSVEDINTKKIKLLDLNIDGYITKDEFIRKNCEYNKKINEINKSINNLLKIEDSKYDLKKEIIELFKSNVVRWDIIRLLLNKIVVYGDFDKIKLDIYLNVICNWCDKIYEFMRGNDVVSTKRYKVLYCVNVKL